VWGRSGGELSATFADTWSPTGCRLMTGN
jgi:hypothetical protein